MQPPACPDATQHNLRAVSLALSCNSCAAGCVGLYMWENRKRKLKAQAQRHMIKRQLNNSGSVYVGKLQAYTLNGGPTSDVTSLCYCPRLLLNLTFLHLQYVLNSASISVLPVAGQSLSAYGLCISSAGIRGICLQGLVLSCGPGVQAPPGPLARYQPLYCANTSRACLLVVQVCASCMFPAVRMVEPPQ